MKFKQTLKDIKGLIILLQQSHRSMMPVLLLSALASASQPFAALLFSARILNGVIQRSFEETVQNITWLLGFNLILGLIQRICTQMISGWRETIDQQVDMRINEKAYRMEYEELEKTQTRDMINRIQSGILGNGGINLQITGLETMLKSIFGCIWSAVFMVRLFSQTGSSGSFFDSLWAILILAVSYGTVLGLSYHISRRAARNDYAMRKENERYNSIFIFFIRLLFNYQNGKEIRMNRMQGLIEHWVEKVMLSDSTYIKWGRINGAANGAGTFLMQLASGLAFLYVGGKAYAGSISIGSVLLYAGAINRLTLLAGDVLREWNLFYYRMQYLKEYKAFIDRSNMHYDGTLPIEKRDDKRYELIFDHVTFCYPGTDQPVLRDISFKFEIGRRYALVGRNGAGKSTLIKLLCHLYEPTSGRILLNGVDIGLYDYDEYVQIFSVVFQDFRLFAFPLGENVAGSQQVDARRARKNLEQVGLGERLETLPEGLSTLLYHNTGDGVELSGGEAQKVAIARALYKDAPFVVLDEPTAALDPLAEAEVYTHFNEMIEDKTAIYISHRMSSCRFCDEILVLEEGQIAERGSHEELLERGGLYAKLYEAQAVHYR